MKCKYCGQNFRTSAEDRYRSRNYGDFSPRYWQTEYDLTDDEVSELGFDPKDNESFICYDCDQKFFDKQQAKAAASRKDWEDENGNVVIKLRKPFNERKTFPGDYEPLDEQLFEDHILAAGFMQVYSNKYRTIYSCNDYYLVVNRPGFDGHVYQMYLFNAQEMHKVGLTIDDLKPFKVFSTESSVGLIAVYEALANGFHNSELTNDMTDIEKLITLNSSAIMQESAKQPKRIEITSEDGSIVRDFARDNPTRVGDTIVDAYDGEGGLEFTLTKKIKTEDQKTIDGGFRQRVFYKSVTWYETSEPEFVVRVTYDSFMEREKVEFFSRDYLAQEGIEI